MRKLRQKPGDEIVKGFRMRGNDVSRIEAFADCVFAFALTLLVVSLEVPKTFSELQSALMGFIPFVACFAIFFSVWNQHYLFCRRYGLQDGRFRFLTGMLVFVVLAYVYPLKFLASIFFNEVVGMNRGHLDSIFSKGRLFEQMGQLFVIYGIGYLLVFLTIGLMYLHAYSLREELELNEIELFETRWNMMECFAQMVVPVISIILALTLPGQMVGLAGYAYFLLAATGTYFGSNRGASRRKLMEKLKESAPPLQPPA